MNALTPYRQIISERYLLATTALKQAKSRTGSPTACANLKKPSQWLRRDINPRRGRNDLTKEQAREISKVIESYQRYLVRLRTRMEKRGFPPTDRTYVNVCRAFDALQALRMSGFHEQAYRMLTSTQARRAFLVDQESSALRDRYGRNEYGESFLLARRLIEVEVRLVPVIWLYVAPSGIVSNVWDTHGGVGIPHGATGWSMLLAPYCLPPHDQAYSAFLEDLHQRGLLDDTLVAAVGKFGRTPRINPQQGREHWGPCFTTVRAGGGVRGGQVFGKSDCIGACPTENPVSTGAGLA
jgi:Protein of unknown function (DUF1501)